MDDQLSGPTKRTPAVKIILGAVLFLLGVTAWSAMVPVTFLGALHSHTHDPVTRSLLMVFLVLFALSAGTGTAVITSKLTLSHVVSRVLLVVFFILLALGLANFIWLGTLPNALETPVDLGPSPNR